MNTRRNGIVISTILIISALIVATAAPALAEPQPPTPFYISGEVNYDNGDPVTNPTVTVDNTNTGEGFDVEITGNSYQITTSSDNVSASDVLHFNASNDNVTEFDHTVTQDEMNAGGFVQDITIVHPAALMPDLIVTAINSYHNNTGCPAWFNLSNEIDVTVKNIGNANATETFNVSVSIEGVPFDGKLSVSGLNVNEEKTVTFEDWKPIGEDCLQPPCDFELLAKYYNFTAVADCDGVVSESNETNNETTVVDKACYNGYMADEPLENVAHGKLHGHMIYTTGDGAYASLYSVGDTQVTNYDITIPAGASVKVANLNVYYTWTKPQGTCPEMEVSIQNGTGTYVLPLEKAYNDVKCTCPGASWVLTWGNYVYDVADYIDGSGTYTVTVKNVCTACQYFCPAAPGIVLVYEDANAPMIEYWINKGADVLMGGRRYPTSSNLAWWECINNATFQASTQTEEVVSATLGVVAPWGDDVPNDILFFNDIELGRGVYHGYSSLYNETIDSVSMYVGASGNAQVGANVTDVTALYLKGSDNVVGQADDGDNIMPCNAFLVVRYEEVVEKPDLTVTEIKPNCGYLFGNESNEICAKIENIGGDDAGAFNVSFVVDGFSEEVRISGLTAGANTTVCVTDSTSRNAGDSVSITVTADCNAEVVESDETNNASTLATTVVNNGYKGKRYTGGEDITTWKTFELKGNLLYSLGDSYYLSSYSYPDWTTYNASWNTSDLPVPGTATIEEARLYVIYTWDKKGVMPDNVSLSFNGIAQTLDAHYSDRKGYGTYNYPYGMLAYDVTDDFSTCGNVANLTNSYPGGDGVSMRGMLLVVVYAEDCEPLRKIIMNEEFDLLYGGSSKCTTPEEATAYAPFGPIDLTGMVNATLITVAPGADGPEGDLSFNDQIWTDVWSFTTAAQIGIDERDVTAYLNETSNEADFRSDGDYMEASNAFLVVEYEAVEEKPDLVIEDIRPIRWCCCCIKEMQVAFVDDLELAKELGNEELRKEVAEALAKDPKLAAEVAAKLAGDDKKSAKELSCDPKQLAFYCCRWNAIKELADLLDTELTAEQQHEMSDVLDEIVGCGGCGCCNCLATDCKCCCCGRLIAYKIANVGDAEAGWSLSNLTVNGRVRSVDIVRPLDAGQSRWEVFPCYRMWWWPRPHEVTVCADVTDWVAESDETNNCRTEWFPPHVTPGPTLRPIRDLK